MTVVRPCCLCRPTVWTYRDYRGTSTFLRMMRYERVAGMSPPFPVSGVLGRAALWLYRRRRRAPPRLCINSEFPIEPSSPLPPFLRSSLVVSIYLYLPRTNDIEFSNFPFLFPFYLTFLFSLLTKNFLHTLILSIHTVPL